MTEREEAQQRSAEFEYAKEMSSFFGSWIGEHFGTAVRASCEQMHFDRRSLLNRIDTHTILEDHRRRGGQAYRFYLCRFHPAWTDCTCEGYHAENFGMIYWQKPGAKDDVEAFCAEKNCPVASHEIAHEMLRKSGYKRYVEDVHEAWMRHYHAGLPMIQYDRLGQRTQGRPKFLTIDMDAVRKISTL